MKKYFLAIAVALIGLNSYAYKTNSGHAKVSYEGEKRIVMCLPPHDTWCWVIDDKGVLTINEKQCLTFSPQNFDITINGISIENGVQNSSIESEELDGIIEISRKK